VLVVRWIKIGAVRWDGIGRGEGIQLIGLAGAIGCSVEHRRQSQLQGLVGTFRPLLQAGHLYAGGGINPISRFDQAGEVDGLQDRRKILGCKLVANGVDFFAILWLKKSTCSSWRQRVL
jgi:hypothetical protein